jgi:mannitol-specific phosphotransferase system IIBC component
MILKKFHIFIRLSGDVLIVVKNLYYLIDFPSFNAEIMVNLLKILEYRKEKELMQYLELILEKHIYFMIKFYILSLMSVCLDQRKTALFQNYLLEYLQI